MKTHELTGQKFGFWKVVERTRDVSKRGSRWRCRCICGIERILNGTALKAGKTSSCGCVTNQTRFKKQFHGGSVARNALVSNYRTTAIERGYSFELTHDECGVLFGSDCFWCGSKPTNLLFAGSKRQHSIQYNGIDRLDNSVGYVVGNVVSCCKVCNRAKGTLTREEFSMWIEQLIGFKQQRFEQKRSGLTDDPE